LQSLGESAAGDTGTDKELLIPLNGSDPPVGAVYDRAQIVGLQPVVVQVRNIVRALLPKSAWRFAYTGNRIGRKYDLPE